MQALYTAIEASNYMEVKKLLTNDKELLEIEDEHGANLLAFSLRKRVDEDILELLLEQGVDAHAIDNEGVNILEYAITYGNIDFVKRSIELGIDVCVTNRRSGFTPLMAAVSYNHPKAVEMLLEKGAPLDAHDNSGFSPMDFARRMHRKKIQLQLENFIKDQQA